MGVVANRKRGLFMSNKKTRNWTFVHYLDEDHASIRKLIEKIEALHVKAFISPLHDKDVNADGEIKKEHYHVALCFDGPTTYNSVKELTEELEDPIPQPVASIIGMLRYLTHKDNPEKFQYSDDDVKFLNGASKDEYLDIITSSANKVQSLRELFKYLNTHDVTEYGDFLDFLVIRDDPEVNSKDYDVWFSLATNSHTLAIKSYLQSKHFKKYNK
jgi:hypothetical protein